MLLPLRSKPLRGRGFERTLGRMTTAGTPEATALGTMIRSTREQLGLSIAEYAARAQIDPDLLGRIESGEHHPSVYMRHHLSRVVTDAIAR